MSFILSAQLLALFKGMGTGAGLIIAIGAQNAFVLTQGLRREYHWPIAGICSLFDAVCIVLGAAGMGALVSQSPVLLEITKWGGALFLTWYGLNAFRSAFNTHSLKGENRGVSSLKQAVVTTLAITALNPHVYLDTVVLLGSIGSQQAEGLQIWFTVGAVCASFMWFFSLSFGARWLAPLFAKPIAWRVLDLTIALVMWSIALSLILN